MTSDRPADYLWSLVRELFALPRETAWVEFKLNEAAPTDKAFAYDDNRPVERCRPSAAAEGWRIILIPMAATG